MDLFGMKRRRSEREFNQEVSLAVQNELERFASATAEHMRSYAELADIAASRLNSDPGEAARNLMQQAGFSAEVKNVARTNAENIIGGKATRVARTDNVGGVNHPQFDLVNVDSEGRPILDASGNFTGGTQQKNFYRIENYDKLLNREYEHYAQAEIALPSDQFQEILDRWDAKIEKYQRQVDYLRQHGNPQKAAEIEEQIKKIKDVRSRARPAKVSTGEAMEARLHPGLSAAKDTLKVANRAGIESAKYGAAIGGGVSVCQNLAAIANGEKDFNEAAIDIAKDTGKAAAVAYAMGAGSAAVGGALKATGNAVCKSLAKGNAPAALIQAGAALAKNALKLATGEIGVGAFVENVGKDGSTLAASFTGGNLGALVGTAVLPGVGTLVGGVLGGVVASLLNGAMYDALLQTARENRLSEEKRAIVHAICQQLKSREIVYQAELTACFDSFFSSKDKAVRSSFEQISKAVSSGESINVGLAGLAKAFGEDVDFKSVSGLESFLSNGETLEL